MAEKAARLKSLPMMENILGQPASHERLLELHSRCRSSTVEAARMLRAAAGRIFVTGMGASLFAAMPAVTYLEQQGYQVQSVESSELLYYGAEAMRPGDVGVLISRSGGSVEVLRLAEKMRKAGVRTVAVTNVPGSPLEQFANVSLQIGSQADQLIAVQTYTGTVLKMMLLAAETHKGSSNEISEWCDAALPALRTSIDECLHRSESWRAWLDQPEPLYLLGRGAALAAVHEGTLLLHETAKAAAVAMSSGQFRHGPVETVTSAFRAIVFGSPARTRELERSLKEDLAGMGATAWWVGPAEGAVKSGATDDTLMTWPAIHPLMAPLFEIVPMQAAAYRLALWRGIVPGDFRHASEITATEAGFPGSRGGGSQG